MLYSLDPFSCLHATCRVMFFVSFLAAACAILLLWFVYPKDFDFGEAAGDSFLFYDAQRVGTLPATSAIPWRSNALTYEADAARGFPDLTGGWLNGGAGGGSVLSGHTSLPFVRAHVLQLLLDNPQSCLQLAASLHGHLCCHQ